MNLYEIENEKSTFALFSCVLRIKAATPGVDVDISLNPNNLISINRAKRILNALPARTHVEIGLKSPSAPHSKIYMQNKNVKKLVDQMLLRITIAQLPKSIRRPILGNGSFQSASKIDRSIPHCLG